MAEIRLKARSPFAGLLEPGRHGAQGGAAGVTLSERTGLALFVISAGAGKAGEVAAKMASVTGLDLPMGPKRVSSNGFALIGTAPGQWLAVAESKEARALPAMLAVALKGLATVVDLSPSRDYTRGHIPGAWFAIRARLASALGRIAPAGTLVLTSEDGVLAGIAAGEAAGLTAVPVRYLAGGNAAWQAAGQPFATEPRMADEPVDTWLKPYERAKNVREAMDEYLKWEVDLLPSIARVLVALVAEQLVALRLGHRPRVHADRRQEAAVAQQRIRQLADQSLVGAAADAFHAHHLLGVMRPAFGKGVADEHPAEHVLGPVGVEEVEEMAGPHLVNRSK